MTPPRLVCPANQPVDPGPSPLRLLSGEQYLNTIGDLVGTVAGLEAVFGNSVHASEFGLVAADVGQVQLETFQQAADLIAAAVVGNATMLNTLVPCASADDKRGCAKAFVQSFGARAYRAPLTDATDIDRHLMVYDLGASTSHAHGIELLLRAILQAPRFLYRVELGTADKVGPMAIKLSGYEVAARLSYALWNSMPDAKLTAAAASGALATKDGVATQVAWMLTDSKGQTVVRRFLEGWTHLDDVSGLAKDKAQFPQWDTGTLKASLAGQARAFFDDVLNKQGGRLSALLTSPTVFANQDLGSYYGVTGGSDFRAVQPTSGPASGMLTLPALLATLSKVDETSPINRGKFIREQLFCQGLPPPPPNVPKAPDVQPGVSTRERFKQHENDPACSTCHQLIDPIGLSFENFDAVGRFRATEDGQAIDTSGEITGTDDANGKFDGVVALGKKLAASKQVQECVSRQWFRFMLSRFERDVDACTMTDLVAKFRAADGSLNSLPLALLQSDGFLYRRPLDAQVSP